MVDPGSASDGSGSDVNVNANADCDSGSARQPKQQTTIHLQATFAVAANASAAVVADVAAFLKMALNCALHLGVVVGAVTFSLRRWKFARPSRNELLVLPS